MFWLCKLCGRTSGIHTSEWTVVEFQCSVFVSFLFHPMHLTEEPWTLEELMGAIGKLQINKIRGWVRFHRTILQIHCSKSCFQHIAMKNGTTFLSPVPFRLGKLFFPNIAGETGTPHWSFNFEPLPLFDDFKIFLHIRCCKEHYLFATTVIQQEEENRLRC